MHSTVVDLMTPSHTRVRLSGDLEASEVPEFLESVHPLVSETQSLEIDLSELAFLHTTGLAAFVSLWKELDSTGGCFRLVRVSAFVRRKLAVTGLDSVLMDDDPALEP
jgi:anti-sigma B factor antagonist